MGGEQARSNKTRLDTSNADKGRAMRFATIVVRFSMSITMLLAVASAPVRAQEPDASYYMAIFSAQADSRDLALGRVPELPRVDVGALPD